MIDKIKFLNENRIVVERKAVEKWCCSGDFVVSKNVIKALNSEIFDYLSLNNVYVNFNDCDFEKLVLKDLNESILNLISHFEDYTFMGNFKESIRQVHNKERDRLMKFAEIIDFEMFRPILELIINHGEQGGRPGHDPVFMIKIEFLRTYYNLSDEKIARRIKSDDALQCFLSYPWRISM